jgi:hypothetical protein
MVQECPLFCPPFCTPFCIPRQYRAAAVMGQIDAIDEPL